MISCVRKPGATLIELVITIALMGLIASVTTLALRRIAEPPPDDPARMLGDSLRVVLATGRAATVLLVVNGGPVLATIHPDGSVVADSVIAVERLSGTLRGGP